MVALHSSDKRKTTERVTIRMRPDERDKLRLLCEQSGLTASTYMKSVALSPNAKIISSNIFDVKTSAKILGELGRISNNVNQIAKACNSGIISASFLESASIIAELQGIRHLLVGLTNEKRSS